MQRQDWIGDDVTFEETVNDGSTSTNVPTNAAALSRALIAQREYTLALYADIPSSYWEPRTFPMRDTINPPLWELAHIGWFQEFFALRWQADDVSGSRSPSCLNVADQLFDSRSVAHSDRWRLTYPSQATCFDYMQRVLDKVNDALAGSLSPLEDLYGFQLVLLHEDMHAEALAMTLTTLGLALPTVAPKRVAFASHQMRAHEINVAGGPVVLGRSEGVRARAFSFDNEKPAHRVQLEPFAIDARVVSAAEFATFVASAAFNDPRLWSAEGNNWREARQMANVDQRLDFAAMHVNYFEAEAYCRWQSRRLPTEAEWECAAILSQTFFASTGNCWEWTATPFAPYPGFQAERYREYSEPWFQSHGVRYQVLKGGSFVTHSRLKYPQYRNFYTPDRNDMFCGFRTCAIR